MGKGPFTNPAASTANLIFESLFENGTASATFAAGDPTPFSVSNMSTSATGASNLLTTTGGNVVYLAADNFPTRVSASGCIRFVMRHDSGTVWSLGTRSAAPPGPGGDGNDRFTFWNIPTSINLLITDSGGTRVFNDVQFTDTVASGETNEYELNWREGSPASIWLYINGVQNATVHSANWTSGTAASAMKFGNLIENSGGGNHAINNIRMFSALQHDKGSGSYTPDF